jgi:hypothetical protein
MKLLTMTRQKESRLSQVPPLGPAPSGSRTEGAFDLWLQRELHRLFDGVAREPIPQELLRLIEQDREQAARAETPPKPKPDEAG